MVKIARLFGSKCRPYSPDRQPVVFAASSASMKAPCACVRSPSRRPTRTRVLRVPSDESGGVARPQLDHAWLGLYAAYDWRVGLAPRSPARTATQVTPMRLPAPLLAWRISPRTGRRRRRVGPERDAGRVVRGTSRSGPSMFVSTASGLHRDAGGLNCCSAGLDGANEGMAYGANSGRVSSPSTSARASPCGALTRCHQKVDSLPCRRRLWRLGRQGPRSVAPSLQAALPIAGSVRAAVVGHRPTASSS